MAYSILTEEPRTLFSGISCDANLLHGVNTQRKLRWDAIADPAQRTEHPNGFLILRRDVGQGQMGVDRQAFLLGVATQ